MAKTREELVADARTCEGNLHEAMADMSTATVKVRIAASDYDQAINDLRRFDGLAR